MFAQASDQLYQACNDASNCPAEYSDLLRQYLTVGLLMLVAVGLVAGMLGVAMVLRPSRRTGTFQDQKHLTYESGVDPVGSGWSQSNVRYYVFAVLFVLFDVEAVFIFPWALRLETYGTFGLVEMLVFIAILVLGLVYAWRKKVLQWL
jgi:NADH-quinone oxidoreductase subunit A